MKDLYLATYCFGQKRLSSEEMIKTAADLGFQGMEFLSPVTQQIADELKKYNMKIMDAASSGDKELLVKLGVKYVPGAVSFGDRQQTLRAAEQLNVQGREAAKYGMKVYYHNHTHEWRQVNGEYLMEILLNNTDPDLVCMQMDAGWAACAGVDIVEVIKKYSGRVELMHVKASTGILGPEGVSFVAPAPDGQGPQGGPPPAGGGDPGAGGPPAGGPPQMSPEMEAAFANIRRVSGAMKDCIVDYKQIMETAEAHGCKAFILERDEHYLPDPIDCIREDITELRKFW